MNGSSSLILRQMNSYPSKVEQQMQQFYHSLSEKDRRRYAAIEALKLGWGGITYISQLFGCDYYTILDNYNYIGKEKYIPKRKYRYLTMIGSL